MNLIPTQINSTTGEWVVGFCEESELVEVGMNEYTVDLGDVVPCGGSILMIANTTPLQSVMYSETTGHWHTIVKS